MHASLDFVLSAKEMVLRDGVAALVFICKKSSQQLEKGWQRGQEGAGEAVWRLCKNESVHHGGDSGDGEQGKALGHILEFDLRRH